MNPSGPFKRVLISEDEIQKRTAELADQINKEFAGETVYILSILKGSYMFLAELSKKLNLKTVVDFMVVSSYGNDKVSSGRVRIIKDIYSDLEGKNVIIIEDIVDTGLTINFLRDLFKTRGPKSIKVCTMLFKKCCYKLEIPPEYVGFEIEDVFVAGYGLDLEQYYRNVPYVGEVNLDWSMENDK